MIEKQYDVLVFGFLDDIVIIWTHNVLLGGQLRLVELARE